jgi:hypothetical protein
MQEAKENVQARNTVPARGAALELSSKR